MISHSFLAFEEFLVARLRADGLVALLLVEALRFHQLLVRDFNAHVEVLAVVLRRGEQLFARLRDLRVDGNHALMLRAEALADDVLLFQQQVLINRAELADGVILDAQFAGLADEVVALELLELRDLRRHVANVLLQLVNIPRRLGNDRAFRRDDVILSGAALLVVGRHLDDVLVLLDLKHFLERDVCDLLLGGDLRDELGDGAFVAGVVHLQAHLLVAFRDGVGDVGGELRILVEILDRDEVGLDAALGVEVREQFGDGVLAGGEVPALLEVELVHHAVEGLALGDDLELGLEEVVGERRW